MALKKRGRAKLRLTGNECPTVDVFITCCGEDDEVVIDTVRGACDQDYPRDQMRVIILDDAKSATLEAACNELAVNHPNVIYMAREKDPRKAPPLQGRQPELWSGSSQPFAWRRRPVHGRPRC
jgi:Glycosyltransferases, probably involved in cell wall biogenesis